MKYIQWNIERFILLTCLGLFIIMAWQSEGYYHWDEHYQLLEFAQYKSGLAAKEGLAWEFQDQIRPGLQPFIAFAFLEIFTSIGISDPFMIAFILRLFSALFSFYVVVALGHYILKLTASKMAQRVFLTFSFFLWCSAFLQVRFSSENWSGLAFILGFLCWSHCDSTSTKKNAMMLIVSGLCFSLAFQFRYQIAFAMVGFALWMLFNFKTYYRQWGLMTIGLISGVLIGLLADYWLYGNWQLTSYYYFTKNITQGKAATFGVEPWWYYFKVLFLRLGPGINIISCGLAIYGMFIYRRHALLWALIVFVIGHSIVGHKEMRFLFPMFFPFLFFISVGVHSIWAKNPFRKWICIVIIPVCIVNCGLLYVRLVTPAHTRMPYYKYMYTLASRTQKITMYFLPENNSSNNMYGPSRLRMTFYRPKNLIQIPLSDPTNFARDKNQEQSYFFTINPLDPEVASKMDGPVFKYTNWDLTQFNFGGWPRKTTHFWSIYSVKK